MEEVSPEGKVPSMLRTGTEYEASGSTRDIHELQAALQAAQLTATGTGSRYSGKINFIMKTLIYNWNVFLKRVRFHWQLVGHMASDNDLFPAKIL